MRPLSVLQAIYMHCPSLCADADLNRLASADYIFAWECVNR